MGVGDKVSWQGKSGWKIKEIHGEEHNHMVTVQKGTSEKVAHASNLQPIEKHNKAPDSWKAAEGDFSPPPTSEDPAPGGRYFYHASPVQHVDSIAKEGISHANELGQISAAPHLDSVDFWGSVAGGGDPMALFRTPQKGTRTDHSTDDAPYDPHEETAEVRIKPVSPDKLEVYHNGKWKPVSRPTNNAVEQARYLIANLDADSAGRFITLKNGNVVHIGEGETVKEAIGKHFDKVSKAAGHEVGHGHSHGPEHSLEHTAHDVHHAHEAAEAGHAAVEALLGGKKDSGVALDAAHAAAKAALGEGAGHAADVAQHGHDLAHAGANLSGIVAAKAYPYAVKVATAAISRLGPQGKAAAERITALHDGAKKVAEKLAGKLAERYGKATAGAIMGAGALAAEGSLKALGMPGPLTKLVPFRGLVGAVPFVAAAEVGRQMGLIGPGTKSEKGLMAAATWVHGVRGAIGRNVKSGAKWAKGKVVGNELLYNEDEVTMTEAELKAAAKEFYDELKAECDKLTKNSNPEGHNQYTVGKGGYTGPEKYVHALGMSGAKYILRTHNHPLSGGEPVHVVVSEGQQPHEGMIHESLKSARADMRRNGFTLAHQRKPEDVENARQIVALCTVAADTDLDDLLEVVANCGGPGSGVPGPCAKQTTKTVTRAYHAAAAKKLAKAAEQHAKHGTKATAKALDEAHHEYMSRVEAASKPEKTNPKKGKAGAGATDKTAKAPPSSIEPSKQQVAAVEKVHGSSDKFVDHVVRQYLTAHDNDFGKSADKPNVLMDKKNKALDVIQSGKADTWLKEALPAMADKHAATAGGRGITKPEHFASLAGKHKGYKLGGVQNMEPCNNYLTDNAWSAAAREASIAARKASISAHESHPTKKLPFEMGKPSQHSESAVQSGAAIHMELASGRGGKASTGRIIRDHQGAIEKHITAAREHEESGNIEGASAHGQAAAAHQHAIDVHKGTTTNADESFEDKRSELSSQLSDRIGDDGGDSQMKGGVWISDLYDDYIIYQNDGKWWKLGYEDEDGECKLSDEEPVEVKRRTIYEPVDNSNPEGHNQYTGSSSAHEATGKAIEVRQGVNRETAQKLNKTSYQAKKASDEGDSKKAADLHEFAQKMHSNLASQASKRGDARLASAHEKAAELHGAAADHHGNLTGNAERPNALLGRGNHSLAKRSQLADSLTHAADTLSEHADADETHQEAADAHMIAADAHRSAAKEAAGASASKAERDYVAAGKHQNKAQYHLDKAEEHEKQLTGNSNPEGHNQYTGSSGSKAAEASLKARTASGDVRAESEKSRYAKLAYDNATRAYASAKREEWSQLPGLQQGEKLSHSASAIAHHTQAASAHHDAARQAHRAGNEELAKKHLEARDLHREAIKAHKELPTGNATSARKESWIADGKCPKCGGKIEDGKCEDCGEKMVENDEDLAMAENAFKSDEQRIGFFAAGPGEGASESSVEAHAASAKAEKSGSAKRLRAAAAAHKEAAADARDEGDKETAKQHSSAAAYHSKQAKKLSNNSTGGSIVNVKTLEHLDKKTLIEGLLKNNIFKATEKLALNAMSEEAVRVIAVNAFKRKKGEEDDDSSMTSSELEHNGAAATGTPFSGKPTGNAAKDLAKWEESMPAAAKDVWNTAKKVTAREKAELVTRLLVNVRNPETRKAKAAELLAKSTPELHSLLELMPTSNQHDDTPVENANDLAMAMFLGSQGGGETHNAGGFSASDDLLDMPTMDWGAKPANGVAVA